MKMNSIAFTRVIASILCVCLSCGSTFAVGLVNFANSPAQFISTGNAIMPSQEQQKFYFAVFLAAPDTVTTAGQTTSLLDPAFQFAAAYNTNHATAAGRIFTRNAVDVGTPTGFEFSQPVDFVIRGWSSNLGETWLEARDNWFGPFGVTLKYFDGLLPWIGSSTVGNDLILGGGPYPIPTLLAEGPNAVRGFALHTIPEPTTLTLLVLAVSTWGLRKKAL